MKTRWKVLYLELNEGIPTLPLTPGYEGLFVVFCWHSIPLGHQDISAAQLPMPATQLANLVLQSITPTVTHHLLKGGGGLPGASAHSSQDISLDFDALTALKQPLGKLGERWLKPVRYSVSVVVCTRDRPEQLARCLRSLQNLSQPPHEILVVDNAPNSDATNQLVAQMQRIQYVIEPRPGLSVARNTGIRHTTGEIIAFTDDDVIVHPEWITRLQQSFHCPQVMAVTGLVLPAEIETEAQFIFEKGFGGFSRGYYPLLFDTQFFKQRQSRGVPVWDIGAGANMAFRRKAFELVGDFDERLGAGASGCSEDSELWYRLLAEGWYCYYEPTAVAFHYHRSDLDSLKQQMYQYMRGHVVALLVQFAKYKHWGNLHRLFFALPRYYNRRLLSGLFKGFNSLNKTLLAEVLGCCSGLKFYLQSSIKPINFKFSVSMMNPFSKDLPVFKAPLSNFLACNPFPHPLTQGFFYREKMRAIHRITPDESFQNILEIGGGQGGLTALLYPRSQVTNIDINPQYADAPCNKQKQVRFVCGDATDLPFASQSFDTVTMFDVLEHISDCEKAVLEALRVLRPQGFLLISTPNENWRFPYYKFMQSICPDEAEIMAEWGHVRRGYTLDELKVLIGVSCQRYATFINPVTVLCHDIAFSTLR